jgi:threonine/homoserine/homoserine lactone efflux protein
MLALVLTQTIRHGSREGCKIALTPLVTDAPIILVATALAAKLAQLRSLLGIVSIAGGVFVLYLAWETSRPVGQEIASEGQRSRSWLKGVVTNLLNPHPWLFWLTVGAAMLAKTVAQGWLVALAFLFGFYLLLVVSKVLVALLTARSRNLLAGRPYRTGMRFLGVLLGLFAILLFREGLKQLAVL